MSEASSKKAHPAGKKRIPRVEILQRLSALVSEHQWLYGEPTADVPTRMERWDVRSMLDYAVLTYELGHFRPGFGTFYYYRQDVMQLLMEMAEVENYGEWRFWETAKERTAMDIARVINRALEAEKKR